MAEEASGQAPAQPTLPDSMNPHEAQSLIAQMIEAQETPDQPRDEKGKFAKPETEEAKPETEATEEKAEAPVDDEQPEIKPEPRKFKLRYKGEEREVDEPETIELAQKGFDYTQKMQQLAKDREEVQVKVKTEQEAVRKLYEQQLEVQRQAVLKLADQEALTADLAKIALEDPAKALRLQLQRQQIVETFQAINAEQQKLAQQRQAEFQESQAKTAREAVEKLQEKIPGWSNDLYGKILKDAVSTYGFSNQEVNAIVDPRAIEVLNDARQWREYQAAKPKTVDKKVPPVAPKVQKPGGGEKPNQSADGFKKSMARFNETGDRSAAVDVVRQMIESGRL